MTLKLYKFSDVADAGRFLNGTLTCTRNSDPNLPSNGLYLVGKTLKFNKPSVQLVTFVASGAANKDPRLLLSSDISSQIEAVFGGTPVKASLMNNRNLMIYEVTPTHGIEIDCAASTAAADFGLPTTGVVTTRVVRSPYSGTPPPAPYLVQAYALNNFHCLVVEEG